MTDAKIEKINVKNEDNTYNQEILHNMYSLARWHYIVE